MSKKPTSTELLAEAAEIIRAYTERYGPLPDEDFLGVEKALKRNGFEGAGALGPDMPGSLTYGARGLADQLPEPTKKSADKMSKIERDIRGLNGIGGA